MSERDEIAARWLEYVTTGPEKDFFDFTLSEIARAVAAEREMCARYRSVIERADAAMEAMNPANHGEMTDSEFARLWNATMEMLSAALVEPKP